MKAATSRLTPGCNRCLEPTAIEEEEEKAVLRPPAAAIALHASIEDATVRDRIPAAAAADQRRGGGVGSVVMPIKSFALPATSYIVEYNKVATSD